VSGGLIIEVDPETRIYVGDKLVGISGVAFALGELFGDESHSAIAVELSDPDQPITAEMLSGSHATIVSQSIGMGISDTAMGVGVSGTVHVRAHLIRRADGALDPVFALILISSPPKHSPGSYLLPIRLRKGPAPSAFYFHLAGLARTEAWHPFMNILGRPVNEANTKFSFTATNPPEPYAEEIKAKGLWEPTGAK